MINEIKTIIQNYLSNAKLCQLMVGTVADDGIKVSDRLTIPNELIKGDLKEFVAPGDRVRLIRNHGGQEFYIVEIIEKKAIFIGTVVSAGIDTGTETIPNELIIGNLKEFVAPGDKVRLIRNLGGQEFYIVEIIGVPNVLNKMTIDIEPITVTGGMTITNIKIKDVRR